MLPLESERNDADGGSSLKSCAEVFRRSTRWLRLPLSVHLSLSPSLSPDSRLRHSDKCRVHVRIITWRALSRCSFHFVCFIVASRTTGERNRKMVYTLRPDFGTNVLLSACHAGTASWQLNIAFYGRNKATAKKQKKCKRHARHPAVLPSAASVSVIDCHRHFK